MNSEFWWGKLQIRQPRKAEIIWETWVYLTQSSRGSAWERLWSLESVECPLCPASEKDKYTTLCSNIIVLNLALTCWEVVHLPHGLFLGNCHFPQEQTLGGHTHTHTHTHTQTCVHQDPGERSSDPTKDWLRLAHKCPAVSGGGVGSSGLLQGWGHRVQQCLHGTFWRSCHYLHYLHHSLASGQITQGGNTAPLINRKLD